LQDVNIAPIQPVAAQRWWGLPSSTEHRGELLQVSLLFHREGLQTLPAARLLGGHPGLSEPPAAGDTWQETPRMKT